MGAGMADGYATGRRLSQEDARIAEQRRARQDAERARREEMAARERQQRREATLRSGEAADRRKQQEFENDFRTGQADFERRRYDEGAERQRKMDEFGMERTLRQEEFQEREFTRKERSDAWDDADRSLAQQVKELELQKQRAVLDEYMTKTKEERDAMEQRKSFQRIGVAGLISSAMANGGVASRAALDLFQSQTGIQIPPNGDGGFLSADGIFYLDGGARDKSGQPIYQEFNPAIVQSVLNQQYGDGFIDWMKGAQHYNAQRNTEDKLTQAYELGSAKTQSQADQKLQSLLVTQSRNHATTLRTLAKQVLEYGDLERSKALGNQAEAIMQKTQGFVEGKIHIEDFMNGSDAVESRATSRTAPVVTTSTRLRDLTAAVKAGKTALSPQELRDERSSIGQERKDVKASPSQKIDFSDFDGAQLKSLYDKLNKSKRTASEENVYAQLMEFIRKHYGTPSNLGRRAGA